MPDSSLLFNDTADRPGTHVLLIGIGDYPWLEGGSNYDAERDEDNAKGMAQLPSPPVSMRNLADWYFEDYNNPDQQLASLSLVLSETTESRPYTHEKSGARQAPQTSGTIGEIIEAVDAWIERASRRRDNGIVFGFCGHGLQSGHPVLLCRDYGKSTQQPFRGAINFEAFRIALSTMQPDQQLMFVDACRTPDLESALLGQGAPGTAMLDVQSLTARNNAPAYQSVHFATSLYTKAWGRKNGASLFTEAIIKALSGGAAEHTAGWWVTTSRLHTVLSTYLQRISAKEKVVQIPAAQTQDFRITKPRNIAVDLYVSSSESAIWQEELKIFAKRGNTVASQLDHAPSPTSTQSVEMSPIVNRFTDAPPKGADFLYKIHAEFSPDSIYDNCVEEIIAYPPEVDCHLPVSKRR